MTDTGPANGVATSWTFPPTLTDPQTCINLPLVNGPTLGALADVPYQGQTITPTCNPGLLSTALAPNPANTYFNQLGCSISHGAATTPQTATTYLFTAGLKSGLFNIPLSNVANPVIGGTAGKVAATPGAANYYSDIPSGQKLTSGAISTDGKFAIATSLKHSQTIYTCLNPLGDPGDPGKPINPAFIVPSASTVKCMSTGNSFLSVDFTTNFGPDNQPYFGGQRVVTTFNGSPGGTGATAWPQCITQNTNATLAQVFATHSANHCGNATPNAGFLSALVTSPFSMITHGSYMYAGLEGGGTITQMKVTVDPLSGFSNYKFRTYLTGTGRATGLGVSDDLGSLMIYVDPTLAGTAGAETVTKLPLCEDF